RQHGARGHEAEKAERERDRPVTDADAPAERQNGPRQRRSESEGDRLPLTGRGLPAPHHGQRCECEDRPSHFAPPELERQPCEAGSRGEVDPDVIPHLGDATEIGHRGEGEQGERREEGEAMPATRRQSARAKKSSCPARIAARSATFTAIWYDANIASVIAADRAATRLREGASRVHVATSRTRGRHQDGYWRTWRSGGSCSGPSMPIRAPRSAATQETSHDRSSANVARPPNQYEVSVVRFAASTGFRVSA